MGEERMGEEGDVGSGAKHGAMRGSKYQGPSHPLKCSGPRLSLFLCSPLDLPTCRSHTHIIPPVSCTVKWEKLWAVRPPRTAPALLLNLAYSPLSRGSSDDQR